MQGADERHVANRNPSFCLPRCYGCGCRAQFQDGVRYPLFHLRASTAADFGQERLAPEIDSCMTAGRARVQQTGFPHQRLPSLSKFPPLPVSPLESLLLQMHSANAGISVESVKEEGNKTRPGIAVKTMPGAKSFAFSGSWLLKPSNLSLPAPTNHESHR